MKSILLKSEAHVYKRPVRLREVDALVDATTLQLEHAIALNRIYVHGMKFFGYDNVPHDPLTVSEAAHCMFSFVKEVARAIQALHDCGFAHQDVRLPNICFSKANKPVLIDVDRLFNVYKKP